MSLKLSDIIIGLVSTFLFKLRSIDVPKVRLKLIKVVYTEILKQSPFVDVEFVVPSIQGNPELSGKVGIPFDKISTSNYSQIAFIYGCQTLQSIDFHKNLLNKGS